jgi:CCR4-NOT complex subunit CAF16
MGGLDAMVQGGAEKRKQQEESGATPAAGPAEEKSLETVGLNYRYGGGATIHDRAYSEPKLIDVNCAFEKGCRVLVAGANGAGKSTLLSIMGGKKMVARDQCRVLGKAAFHDSTLNRDRMYCGDWWRTDFFFNISVAELIGEEMLKSERVQKLIDIMQINISWRVNAISDGQRRRCQLLECLAQEKSVYILDEITTDLDLYAREGLLRFLREETEEKGATIFYATHIFDHLADWATHMLFFSQAKVAKCCRMEDLTEYQALLSKGARVPLYTLMKEWVFRDYAVLPAQEEPTDADMAPAGEAPALETRSLTYSYGGGSPQLTDVSFTFRRGARILVVGANGAGKSTLLSILGGKRMIPRGLAYVMGKDAFNDAGVAEHIMYCGDWWRTNFFMNLSVRDLLGKVCETARCDHLVAVLQVNLDWRINEVSDGQRRRCQLLELLATPRAMYLMDEITSDLDLFAREGILNFMRAECEIRGATIFYCTHIFDHLEGWATHLLHLSQGRVVKHCSIDEVEEYSQLTAEGDPTPLYSLIRRWIYAEYGTSAALAAKPWRKLDESLDGRIPNLGLAGPTMMRSG